MRNRVCLLSQSERSAQLSMAIVSTCTLCTEKKISKKQQIFLYRILITYSLLEFKFFSFKHRVNNSFRRDPTVQKIYIFSFGRNIFTSAKVHTLIQIKMLSPPTKEMFAIFRIFFSQCKNNNDKSNNAVNVSLSKPWRRIIDNEADYLFNKYLVVGPVDSRKFGWKIELSSPTDTLHACNICGSYLPEFFNDTYALSSDHRILCIELGRTQIEAVLRILIIMRSVTCTGEVSSKSYICVGMCIHIYTREYSRNQRFTVNRTERATIISGARLDRGNTQSTCKFYSVVSQLDQISRESRPNVAQTKQRKLSRLSAARKREFSTSRSSFLDTTLGQRSAKSGPILLRHCSLSQS